MVERAVARARHLPIASFFKRRLPLRVPIVGNRALEKQEVSEEERKQTAEQASG